MLDLTDLTPGSVPGLGADSGPACDCDPSVEAPAGRERHGVRLAVTSDGCPGRGDLVHSPDCRAAVVDALTDRDVDRVVTRADGRERAYEGAAAALLVAAGRFVDRVAVHDERLAETARSDPLAAAREATGRAGPPSRIAAETGLSECAARVDGYADALRPFVGPTVARSRVARRPPAEASLVDATDLDTGATVRRYAVPGGHHYHVEPVPASLDDDALATLETAHERLADGVGVHGDRAPGRAVREVADPDAPVETLTDVLYRHTRGHGVLDHLFADPRVSDVFATAPVTDTPVRVTVDGVRAETNVRLTADGAAALASRFRRTSGRAFSRAAPTLDATVEAGDTRIRVAGVTAPASDGVGFAFRVHDRRARTVPGLVANDTLPPSAAGLLSVAVERAAAGLLAGPRGAGKTTLLGALLWELPPSTRTVVIEDTRELPVSALREVGRDVQALNASTDDGPEPTPTEALRTALRLGDGALVLGEVRGEEAATLYEAMRVGAAGDAVLGTVHGEDATAVRERVVTDLGVPASSFASTDLLVTLAPDHRVDAIVEVRRTGDGSAFETLYEREDLPVAEGPVARGTSRLVASLAGPDESYAAVRERVHERADRLEAMAAADRTRPADVAAAARERAD